MQGKWRSARNRPWQHPSKVTSHGGGNSSFCNALPPGQGVSMSLTPPPTPLRRIHHHVRRRYWHSQPCVEGHDAGRGCKGLRGAFSSPIRQAIPFFKEDDEGNVHDIVQGEGGEQSDPLMPALHSLTQHGLCRQSKKRLTRQKDSSRRLHGVSARPRSTTPRNPRTGNVDACRHPAAFGKGPIVEEKRRFPWSADEPLALMGNSNNSPPMCREEGHLRPDQQGLNNPGNSHWAPRIRGPLSGNPDRHPSQTHGNDQNCQSSNCSSAPTLEPRASPGLCMLFAGLAR